MKLIIFKGLEKNLNDLFHTLNQRHYSLKTIFLQSCKKMKLIKINRSKLLKKILSVTIV